MSITMMISKLTSTLNIREATEMIKHLHTFTCEEGCRASGVWSHPTSSTTLLLTNMAPYHCIAPGSTSHPYSNCGAYTLGHLFTPRMDAATSTHVMPRKPKLHVKTSHENRL
jgi:hypothetical protein